MNLRKLNEEEVLQTFGGAVHATLTEFINMDCDCVEVENHGYKSSTAAVLAFRKGAERWNLNQVTCREKNGKVYLMRKKPSVK